MVTCGRSCTTLLCLRSLSTLKKMIPIFCDSSLQLVKLLEQQIGQDNTNIQPHMQVLAWQVLSRTALGARTKTLSEEQLTACSNLAKQVVEEDRRRELPLHGNKWMNKLDRLSLMVPWLSPLFCSIAQWFWMHKQQQMQRVFSLICDHFDQQYGEEELEENIEGSSKSLGLKQLFLLDIFPIKMLQEEIYGVVDGEEMPTYEQLGRLKFATAVIKESVRLNPAGIHSGCTTYPISTFLNTRVCIKKTSLGNVDVEPGVIIQPDLHAINYDKAVWGDNVEEFYPQR
uniref:Uncharacterized protein n=1 Tax=Ditylenchus dipsaci TaxID=166011 RepID=A0A915DU06_9BILA